MSKSEPIIYDQTLDVRFGDLDSFGHVNSMVYLDMVNSSRLIYLERELGVTTADLIRKGLGFYLSKVSQEFVKPITGLVKVRVVSHVAVVDRAKLIIPFEMTNPESGRVYSKGELECYVVNLETQKPMALPDWAADFLFR